METLQRWLTVRAVETRSYRNADFDLDDLLDTEGVVRTGVSAVTDYSLSLGAGATADAYVTVNWLNA